MSLPPSSQFELPKGANFKRCPVMMYKGDLDNISVILKYYKEIGKLKNYSDIVRELISEEARRIKQLRPHS